MNEERYGFRIRQALNHRLNDIPPTALRRLEAARHLAVSRQRVAATEWQLAGHGGAAVSGRSGHHVPYLRQILAVLALLLGMWISFYWHSTTYVSELETVDSALLSDDIPPEAFMDSDFFEWLKDNSLED